MLDLAAFAIVTGLLIRHVLGNMIPERSQTKHLADAVSGGSNMLVLDENCSTCELMSRFDLSRRHRMICAVETWLQLPHTLFYPRWFIDEPPVLHDRWIMIWDANANPAPPAVKPKARVGLRGEEMLQSVCADAIVLLEVSLLEKRKDLR